jgi:ABC-2 type transport system ATP-binding protein
MTALSSADLPRIAAALADFDEVEVDAETSTVSVPAPHGVTTLSEVFRRIDELGVELLDISLRRPSLDEVFLHLTTPATTP